MITAAAGLTSGYSYGARAEKPIFLNYPFSLGVASGDPTADGAVLWTRLAPSPLDPDGGMPKVLVEVSFEVARDDRFRQIVRTGKVLARPEAAHSVQPTPGLGSS